MSIVFTAALCASTRLQKLELVSCCFMQVEHVYGEGWGRPAIHPFADFSIHPAASALHIGLSCFEGMKAYMGVDGRGRLFRFICIRVQL